ncbi:MAG: transposase [Treponema sp.]|nr:transposase [Treponema sp.]
MTRTENRLVVRNGYHKNRTFQTSCVNVEVNLPRIDDRKATEKFVSNSKGFSPATIIRLTKDWVNEFQEWKKRDLTGKEYVYVWADGVYVKSRLDGEKTCLLVIIGVGVDGKKELVAIERR